MNVRVSALGPTALRSRPLRRLASALLLAAMTVFAAPGDADAQATLKIAAVVNDDIISVYDLSQRMNLVMTFSNIPNTPQNQQRIAGDVLRRLILERIRLQEAERLEIEVSEAEINDAISNMEKQNNMRPSAMEPFLESRGIDIESLKEQIRAELSWIAVVRALFRGLVSVSDQEINDEIERMRADAGKPEYLVSEIFLAFDEKPRAEVENIAQRLYSQLTSGASWPQVAQNFSESASAANGGNLGWNQARELGAAVGGVVASMQPGQISQPITTNDGIYIVQLQDKRIAKGLQAGTGEVTVGLQQLHLSIPAGADPQTVADITQRARTLAAGAPDCAALDQIGKSEGSGSSGFLGTFKLDQLNAQFRDMVRNLDVNGVSEPMRTADGVIVLQVCSREAQQGGDPVAEAQERIRLRLINERLARMAQQHEDKLRRQAFIDVRL